jgi:hypothetical protein
MLTDKPRHSPVAGDRDIPPVIYRRTIFGLWRPLSSLREIDDQLGAIHQGGVVEGAMVGDNDGAFGVRRGLFRSGVQRQAVTLVSALANSLVRLSFRS